MLPPQTREGQEVVDELAHQVRARSYHVKFIEGVRIKLIPLLLEDEARISVDGAERRAQIMSDGIAEAFEFLDGIFQLPLPFPHLQLRMFALSDVHSVDTDALGSFHQVQRLPAPAPVNIHFPYDFF